MRPGVIKQLLWKKTVLIEFLRAFQRHCEENHYPTQLQAGDQVQLLVELDKGKCLFFTGDLARELVSVEKLKQWLTAAKKVKTDFIVVVARIGLENTAIEYVQKKRYLHDSLALYGLFRLEKFNKTSSKIIEKFETFMKEKYGVRFETS